MQKGVKTICLAKQLQRNKGALRVLCQSPCQNLVPRRRLNRSRFLSTSHERVDLFGPLVGSPHLMRENGGHIDFASPSAKRTTTIPSQSVKRSALRVPCHSPFPKSGPKTSSQSITVPMEKLYKNRPFWAARGILDFGS